MFPSSPAVEPHGSGVKQDIKGQFTLKLKIHIFPLTCSAIYQSKLFWCELSSFGDISRRDFCLLSNIMGLNGCDVHMKLHDAS